MRPSGTLNVIDFTARDGLFNMALDYHLFSLCEGGVDEAFLRFYTWNPPALSLGFHEPAGIIDEAAARREGVHVVRRPTGGRVVLHKNDLTYAVVLPLAFAGDGPGAYRLVSECIVEGLRSFCPGLRIDKGRARAPGDGAKPCFASTSRYEVTHRERKVVGSAQRVGRRSVLQHGSMPVGREYLEVADYLVGVDAESLRRRVAESTTCLEEAAGKSVRIGEIVQSLRSAFTRGLGLGIEVWEPADYAKDISRLAETLKTGEYPVTHEDKIT